MNWGEDCKVLVGKLGGKTPLERPRRRSQNIIKTNLQEVGWIELAQVTDRWLALVNAVMKLRVP